MSQFVISAIPAEALFPLAVIGLFLVLVFFIATLAVRIYFYFGYKRAAADKAAQNARIIEELRFMRNQIQIVTSDANVTKIRKD